MTRELVCWLELLYQFSAQISVHKSCFTLLYLRGSLESKILLVAVFIMRRTIFNNMPIILFSMSALRYSQEIT